ncbi:MAG TPA: branched-chain amino acid ABC transporter permease [Armatimonadota bacterium]|nr:branched-chain amino acid ABC transporter permease [Armatimonadota bacterium]
MQVFLQQIINGLGLGSIYALIAVGYTLVYGVLRLINFAHGDVFMVGAFLGLFAGVSLHQSLWVSLLFSMAGCALLGILIERLAYRPLRKAPRMAALITAIGVSLLLENGGQLPEVFGPNPQSYTNPKTDLPLFIPEHVYRVGGVSIDLPTICIWIATAIIFVGLRILVTKTKIGKAMRAVQHDQESAALMGIDVNGIILFTFGLGSALAAVAGVLFASEYGQIDPLMGLMPGLKAFIAAVLGGIGSVPGAIIGGLLLGVVETLVAQFQGGATYRDGIAFLILILVLLWKPTGLLGTGAVEKV